MVESSAVSYEFMLQVKQLSSLPLILSRFAAKLIAGVLDFKTIIDKWVVFPHLANHCPVFVMSKKHAGTATILPLCASVANDNQLNGT